MRLLPFLGYTIAGSLLWNAALIGAGYELGAQWHVVERYVGEASKAIYVVLGVAVAVVAVKRSRRALAQRRRPTSRT